jgi:hypothetical protein
MTAHQDSPRVAGLRKIERKLEDYWQELSRSIDADNDTPNHTATCLELIATSRLMNEVVVRIAEVQHQERMAERTARDADAADPAESQDGWRQ